MSIIHFDTMTATGQDGGKLVYPLGGWVWSAGNGNYYGEACDLVFYGNGHARAGEWDIFDFGILEASGTFLTDNGDGIENWLYRTSNLTDDTGGIPGQVSIGTWPNGRTDWRTFGPGHTTGIVEISDTDGIPDWNADDNGYGNNEGVLGVIEFSKYPRDTTDVSFDSTDVNTITNQITIAGHPFANGDQVVYKIPSGETGIAGTGSQGDTSIVDNEFLSIYVIDANTIRLSSNLAGCDATPSLFDLTGTGTGTGHIFKKIEVATASNEGIGSNVVDLYANA